MAKSNETSIDLSSPDHVITECAIILSCLCTFKLTLC